jgi:tetratricopeptide (TPR) repeat protein
MKLAERIATSALWMLAVLIFVAPLPEGGAWPWALTLIESFAFAILALRQLGVASGAGVAVPRTAMRPLLLPAALFGALVLTQLAPLPPAVLRAVSPAAYRLYAVSLPGWPRAPKQPDELRPAAARRGGARWRILPTQDEIARGAALPFAESRGRIAAAQVRSASRAATAASVPEAPRAAAVPQMPGAAGAWRTLSLAPSITLAVLLELAAYAALFFTLLAYPLGPLGAQTQRRLCRAIVTGALLSGLGAAVVGIVEFFTWNGRILWLFVPYDWGAPQPGIALRASGPFVNPDHFGNYLAMVLPLAVSGALFPAELFGRARAFRVLSGVTSFMVTGALLLSLSRGAWMGGAIALAVLFALSAKMARAGGSAFLRQARGRLLRRLGAAGFALVALALLFIGPAGRQLVDSRLRQTVQSDSGLSGRLELGAATLAMARDYPVLGVGLGAWPEAFPRYRRAPWTDAMYREAHDDYAQLLAETGTLGFALVAWFLLAAGARLVRALGEAPHALSPTLAALCAALSAMAFHEFFDFSLHTPANALLFTVLLATALRLAMGREPQSVAIAPPRARRVPALSVGLAAAALTLCALRQDNVPYPENIGPPATVAQARVLIAEHPAESAPHLALVRLAGGRLSPRTRLDELYAAAWLDPTNPYARDAWAGALLEQGRAAQALESIARSVAFSPSPSTHFYLSPRFIPWLSAAQKKAVEQGFEEAIGRRYDGAVQGFADFYDAFGRFAAEGDVYGRAAGAERDPELRAHYLVGAGIAYARAGDLEAAQKFLECAIRGAPASARPYECLVTMVLGPRRKLKAAQAAVEQGVRAGADGAALYAALARAAEGANDRLLAQNALVAAVAARPSFAALFRLGTFYLDEGKYERAALMMRRATESAPRSADAYFYLGLAEERDYRFSAAESDLARALRLAPDNAAYRAHYARFERKLAQSIRSVRPLDE